MSERKKPVNPSDSTTAKAASDQTSAINRPVDQSARAQAAVDTGRRRILTGLGAGAAILSVPAFHPGRIGHLHAATSEPIKIGFQAHRTGIGASYGRWYERTTLSAAHFINSNGGINGREIEIIVEDDGTDPKRGAEVVEKFATKHKTDIAFGTCLLYTSPSPRDATLSRMPSSA